MASLTTQNITIAAPKLDLIGSLTAAAAGGDTAEIVKGGVLVVNNASGSSVTVTVANPSLVSGLTVAAATMIIPTLKCGVIPLSNLFAQSATGRANITYTSATSVTVGVFLIDAS